MIRQMSYIQSPAVMQWDERGNCATVNSAAEDLFGGESLAPLSDWLQAYDFWSGDGITRCTNDEFPLARAARGEEYSAKLLFSRAGIHRLNVNVIACPERKSHALPCGGIAVFQCSSETQEETFSAKARGEFLSRMSQELRTPLNAIVGFAHVLEMGMLTEHARSCVDQVGQAGKQLLKIVDEILDIARGDAGSISVSVEPICVRDSVQLAMSLMCAG